MTETELRDARRGQFMGASWLSEWIAMGRSLDRTRAASWIPIIEAREEPAYCWIWVPPYLKTVTDVDEYRGQQAGKTMLANFAQGLKLVESRLWMNEANRKSLDTNEQWLFLEPILKMDGWSKIVMGRDGFCWTKVGGISESPPRES